MVLFSIVFTFRWRPYTATQSQYSQIFGPGYNHFCALLPSHPVWDFDRLWRKRETKLLLHSLLKEIP